MRVVVLWLMRQGNSGKAKNLAVFTRQFALRFGREANGKDATAASAPTAAAGPPPSDAP